MCMLIFICLSQVACHFNEVFECRWTLHRNDSVDDLIRSGFYVQEYTGYVFSWFRIRISHTLSSSRLFSALKLRKIWRQLWNHNAKKWGHTSCVGFYSARSEFQLWELCSEDGCSSRASVYCRHPIQVSRVSIKEY